MRSQFSKTLFYVVVLLAMLATVTGCTPAATQAPAAPAPTQPPAAVAPTQPPAAPAATAVPAAKKDFNVVLIRWDPNDIYFNGVQHGQELQRDAIMEAEGVTIKFQVFGANDAAKQVNALQQMVDAGTVDGVIIEPWDGKALVSSVQMLNERKIPVVTNNNAVAGGKSVLAAFDNFAAGVAAGNGAVKRLAEVRGADWAKIPGGVILESRCIVTLSADIGRHDGYHSVFDPILKANPGLVWVTGENGCDGAKARKFVEDNITRYGDKILAVLSIDGTMGAGGAVPALDAQGMLFPADNPKHVVITTVDGTQVELQAINKGDMDVASVQPAIGEGWTSMKVLWEMIKSGKQMDAPTSESVYSTGTDPWQPVNLVDGKPLGFEGPWLKLSSYAIPVDRKVDDPTNWGNMMYVLGNNGASPVYDGKFGK